MSPNLSTFTAIVLPSAPFKMATVAVKVICVDALTRESSPFKVKSAFVQIPLSVTVFLTVGSCLCPMLCYQDGPTFAAFLPGVFGWTPGRFAGALLCVLA